MTEDKWKWWHLSDNFAMFKVDIIIFWNFQQVYKINFFKNSGNLRELPTLSSPPPSPSGTFRACVLPTGTSYWDFLLGLPTGTSYWDFLLGLPTGDFLLVVQSVKNLHPTLTPGSGRFPWRRKWQSTPVFLPGESHEHRSLVGYSLRGHKSQTRLSDSPTTPLPAELPCLLPTACSFSHLWMPIKAYHPFCSLCPQFQPVLFL